MRIILNSDQAKGLSNFFFDIAKGLILGGIGLSLAIPVQLKIVTVILSSMLTVACIQMALYLLQS